MPPPAAHDAISTRMRPRQCSGKALLMRGCCLLVNSPATGKIWQESRSLVRRVKSSTERSARRESTGRRSMSPMRSSISNSNSGASDGCIPSPMPVKSRSEEHTSELQSLMRNSYAVFFLKKKKQTNNSKESIFEKQAEALHTKHTKKKCAHTPRNNIL